ncbi:hypothetical protein KSS87_017207 [Heliosperma pusillum]|nr:hypothetical protein KSS87_017207 [Heliosperma pusillum]
MSDQNPQEVEKLVICIGDIHGYYKKLKTLWSNLKSKTNPIQFNNALIIFLGDYCDRGPETKRVIKFLLRLPIKYPDQTHVFLAGNHDLAFAGFVGVLPEPLNGLGFRNGWEEYAQSEEREGWYNGEGFENMHLQGRRWGGKIKVKFNSVKGAHYLGSIYDAAPTFLSYGVSHASSGVRLNGSLDWGHYGFTVK